MASTSKSGGEGILASFIHSVKADLDSPVTSNFGNRIAQYRAQVASVSEQVEADATEFERLRRISKDVEDAMTTLAKQLLAFAHVAKELAEKWSSRSDNDSDSDSAIALLKMELFIRGEAELANGQLRNWHNNMVHPMDLLNATPSEMRAKSVDKACREYEARFAKAEADTRKMAKQCGYTRGQLNHGELAEQLSRERLLVQYELCKFLLGLDSVEDKRGPQLLRHFMELFRNQDEYYQERIKMNEHFRRDLEQLQHRTSARSATRCQQRNALFDLKTKLENSTELVRNSSGRRQSGRVESISRGSRLSGVGLGLAMVPDLDITPNPIQSPIQSTDTDGNFSGYLYKKSTRKLHKLWQKRRCRIFDGHFWLSHSDENVPPAKLDLLVSDCKPSSEDPKAFDLYCRDRTYHLQADNDAEAQQWVVALKREIARVKARMLSGENAQTQGTDPSTGMERMERQLCVSALRRLPGNLECADCSSNEDVQWLSNVGALVCIACSGAHRDLGVHVSRIQSLNLDVISPIEFLVPLATGNVVINRVFEYETALCAQWKPRAGCTRVDRQRFIEYKYRDRCYIHKVPVPDTLFNDATRELDVEKAYRAVLSANLSTQSFEAYGPFHKMIQRGTSMALPIAQLVVQARIELPGLASMLSDCVTNGHSDMLTVLLHSPSMTSSTGGVSLKPLEALAIKLKQNKIVDLLRSAQSGDRSLCNQIIVPSCLVMSTPDSGSLSRSSSSVSPLRRPSPELCSEGVMRVSPSPAVNVLMRNGTTIAVGRSGNNESGSLPDVQSELFLSQRSSSFAPSTTTNTTTNTFRGSTFGKNIPLDDSNRRSSSSTLADSIDMARTPLPLEKRCPETHVYPSGLETQSVLDKAGAHNAPPIVTALDTVIPTQKHSNHPATPNHYTRAPGSLRLSYERDIVDDGYGPSSLPMNVSVPVPALPSQPKPKLYHRSSSEFNNTMPIMGSRDSRDLMTSRAYAHHRASPVSRSESTSGNPSDSSIHNTVSLSLNMASTSLSLDPIPIRSEETTHETRSVHEKETNPDSKLSTNMTVAEKRERISALVSNKDVSNSTNTRGVSKPSVFTAFESARASFMTPSERVRYSMARPGGIEPPPGGIGGIDPPQYHKKAYSMDTTGRVNRPAPPPPPTNLASSSLMKPPIPAPRKPGASYDSQQKDGVRRCRALYDCLADNTDELSFRQGDVIVVCKERIDGENDTWMEGYVAADPTRRGVFPVTFVTFQS